MIAFVSSLLTALAAIPTLLNLIESFAGAVSLWFVQRQNNQTLSMIADAAALAAKATNETERYAAIQAWQAALTRSRASIS